jgi:hypothetical protein
MKTLNKTSRTILAALVAGGALLTAGSAFAQADRVVISAPGPVATYDQPRMIPVGVQIDIGWHGDRIGTMTTVSNGAVVTAPLAPM